MRDRLTTDPTAKAVDIADARAVLKIFDNAFDASISLYLDGIIAETEKETGRALVSQGRRVTYDRFPAAIRLRPPVISVESVKYVDANGQEQTLSPSDYVVDSVSVPAYLVPAPGKAWPATLSGAINAVYVDYTAGYGATAADVPDAAKTYILARLAEQFDPNTAPNGNVKSAYLDRLLDVLRVREFG